MIKRVMPQASERRAYLGRPSWNVGLALLIVVACIWASSVSPQFLSVSQLFGAAQAQMVIDLMVLGMCAIVLVGEIDLSFPANLALCTVVVSELSTLGASVPVQVGGALLCGCVLASINGYLIAYLGLPSLAVTLGTLGVYQGAAYLIGGVGVHNYSPSIMWIGSATVGPVPVSVILFVVLAAGYLAMLEFTRLGRSLYAVGRAREVVHRNGDSTRFLRLVPFIFGGLTVGVASLVYIGYYASGGGSSMAGTFLFVVTAVALGGFDIYGGSGGILGVVLACVLIIVIESGMTLIDVPTPTQTVVSGLTLIVSLTISNSLANEALTRRLGNVRHNLSERFAHELRANPTSEGEE